MTGVQTCALPIFAGRTKRLTFFTAGFTQVSTVFPYAVVSPAYFAGTIQLGGLMQTASAFGSVQRSLSFFVSSTIYREFAEWRAVVQRLAGFQLAVAAGRGAAMEPPVIAVAAAEGSAVQVDGLAVNLPAGVQARVAVLGPMRMQYDRVMSAVHQIGQAFESQV